MEESLIHFTLEFYEWVDPAKNIVELAWMRFLKCSNLSLWTPVKIIPNLRSIKTNIVQFKKFSFLTVILSKLFAYL